MEPSNGPADKLDALVRMLESQKPQTSKILVKAIGRLFLVNQKDICFASIEDGIITVVTSGRMEWKGNRTAARWKNCSTVLIRICSGAPTALIW